MATALLALASLVSPASQPLPDVQAMGAWIRWLPADLPAAGYMTLTNTGAVPAVFVGAGSPDFGQITLHRTRTVQGVKGMVPVDSVTVAPGASVDFAAQGYHLMLMQSRRAVHPGDRVLVTLRFANGGSIDASFEVRAVAAD